MKDRCSTLLWTYDLKPAFHRAAPTLTGIGQLGRQEPGKNYGTKPSAKLVQEALRTEHVGALTRKLKFSHV
jgi:hypothetical protein